MNQSIDTKKNRRLRKQINWKALIRIHGFLLVILSLFMLAPLGVALLHNGPDIKAFAIASASAMGSGCLAMFLCRNHRGIQLGKREGFLLTSSVWIVLSLFGMLPFIIGKPHLGLTDAFFESMSGFTTTGASTITDFGAFTYAMHLWRCMMQWMGGMGIIIFTVALLPMLNSSGGLQMFNAEATGITHDKITPRVSQTAKRLWVLYIILTALLTGLLMLGPMNTFESICHAMSTMSTGGFSTSPDGIGAWGSNYVNFVIMIFMFVGGINFVLLYKLSLGKVRQAWDDEILRAYVKIILIFSLLIAVVGYLNDAGDSLVDYVLYPLFNTVSTISSTGYDVGNICSWGGVVFPILLLLMVVGGCAGSTSGGAKIDRILYLWKNCRNELRRTVHSNRYYPLTVNRRPGGPDVLSKVTAFVVIYIGLIFLGGIVLTLTGMDTGDAFISTLACIGNTASSAEGVAESFSSITDGGKWLLSILMMAGRLEIFTVLVLLTPTFWRRG